MQGVPYGCEEGYEKENAGLRIGRPLATDNVQPRADVASSEKHMLKHYKALAALHEKDFLRSKTDLLHCQKMVGMLSGDLKSERESHSATAQALATVTEEVVALRAECDKLKQIQDEIWSSETEAGVDVVKRANQASQWVPMEQFHSPMHVLTEKERVAWMTKHYEHSEGETQEVKILGTTDEIDLLIDKMEQFCRGEVTRSTAIIKECSNIEQLRDYTLTLMTNYKTTSVELVEIIRLHALTNTLAAKHTENLRKMKKENEALQADVEKKESCILLLGNNLAKSRSEQQVLTTTLKERKQEVKQMRGTIKHLKNEVELNRVRVKESPKQVQIQVQSQTVGVQTEVVEEKEEEVVEVVEDEEEEVVEEEEEEVVEEEEEEVVEEEGEGFVEEEGERFVEEEGERFVEEEGEGVVEEVVQEENDLHLTIEDNVNGLWSAVNVLQMENFMMRQNMSQAIQIIQNLQANQQQYYHHFAP